MSIEKPEKGKMRIVHTGENFGKPENNQGEELSFEGSDKNDSVEFFKKISLFDPDKEKLKNELIKSLKNETDEEKRKQLEFALRDLLNS